MVSSSVSSKKTVGGILGGVFSHGFSIPEWFVLEMVESTHITTSCRGGSTDTDSDDVSSCCKNFRDRRFEYPVGLCAGKRVMSSCSVATSTKHATIVVCCACTDLPGVPKVLSG